MTVVIKVRVNRADVLVPVLVLVLVFDLVLVFVLVLVLVFMIHVMKPMKPMKPVPLAEYKVESQIPATRILSIS